MNGFFTDTKIFFLDIFEAFEDSIFELFPHIVTIFILILASLLVATAVRFLTMRILRYLAVDKLVGKTPIEPFLKKIGISHTTSEIVAWLLFWLVALFPLIYVSKVTEFEPLSQVFLAIASYIPKILIALFILIFGMLLGKFLQNLVTHSASRVQDNYARLMGKIVNILVLIFVFVAALEQLGIHLSNITLNAVILLSSFVLILSIGVIVCAREILTNILACYQIKKSLHLHQHISITEIEGTVKSFSLTSVILEYKDKEITVPARFFFQHTYVASSHDR